MVTAERGAFSQPHTLSIASFSSVAFVRMVISPEACESVTL
jgi:hypothetical protein